MDQCRTNPRTGNLKQNFESKFWPNAVKNLSVKIKHFLDTVLQYGCQIEGQDKLYYPLNLMLEGDLVGK